MMWQSLIARSQMIYERYLLNRQPAEGVYSSITIAPDPSWEALKNTTLAYAVENNQTAFEQAILAYDSSISLASGQSQFIGRGVGHNSLNTYRKMVQDHRVFFEKIYYSSDVLTLRLTWFSNEIYPQLASVDLCSPAIVNQYCGSLLCVIYYEWFDAPLDNQQDFLPMAIATSIKLSHLSTRTSPIQLRDLAMHDSFASCWALSCNLLASELVEQPHFLRWRDQLSQCYAKVSEMPNWITHGDLHGKNMSATHIVIDWDECGAWPMGLDIALSISKSRIIASVNHLNQILDSLVKPLVSDSVWADLRTALLFYCFIFYSRKLGRKMSYKTWLDLFKFLIAGNCN